MFAMIDLRIFYKRNLTGHLTVDVSMRYSKWQDELLPKMTDFTKQRLVPMLEKIFFERCLLITDVHEMNLVLELLKIYGCFTKHVTLKPKKVLICGT